MASVAGCDIELLLHDEGSGVDDKTLVLGTTPVMIQQGNGCQQANKQTCMLSELILVERINKVRNNDKSRRYRWLWGRCHLRWVVRKDL